jgi:hypothetical protein
VELPEVVDKMPVRLLLLLIEGRRFQAGGGESGSPERRLVRYWGEVGEVGEIGGDRVQERASSSGESSGSFVGDSTCCWRVSGQRSKKGEESKKVERDDTEEIEGSDDEMGVDGGRARGGW